MKNSILTLMAVLSVGVAQAASLNWTISMVPDASSGYTALLFITEQAKDYGGTVTTLSNLQSLAGDGKYDDLIDLAVASTTTTANISNKATGYNGNAFDNGDSLKAIAMIIDNEKKNYFLTGERSASWTSGTGAKNLAFGSQANATYLPFGTSQPDIPEPATGALALAGVALLFRRRR